MIDNICTNRHRLSQNLVESYLLENLEQEFNSYQLRVKEIKKQNKKMAPVRTAEQIDKELERLNILFQKGRVSWDYYSEEYDKLEDEKKNLMVILPEPEENYSHIEAILSKDFREIYQTLTPENKRAFWRNVIKEIHLKSDYTVDCVDFL